MPLRVLVVHNRYRQPGGEDTVADSEAALLRAHGHEVVEYHRSNDEVRGAELLTLPGRMIWAADTYHELRHLIRERRPDIAHCHNTFFMVSPSAYDACRAEGVPVVQSLHNPRLVCPAASLYRDGKLCESCVDRRIAWPGIVHGCWRGSRAKTALVAGMLAYHRWRRTWVERVNAYVVFTEFYRHKFEAWGLPADRIFLKPHFVGDPPEELPTGQSRHALFVGRLDPYKGVETMLAAWEGLADVPLAIRGDGHLESRVRAWISGHPGHRASLVGRLERGALLDLVRQARFLVWPSQGHYETFGLVAVEAFACGIPVIASRIGVLPEIVEDNRTGLLFEPGNAEDLAAKVRWAAAHPEAMAEMGRNARRVYEEKYTPERNYAMLMKIYTTVLARAGVDGARRRA